MQHNLVAEPTSTNEFLHAVVESLRQSRRTWTKSFDLAYVLVNEEDKTIEMQIYENGTKKYYKLQLVEV